MEVSTHGVPRVRAPKVGFEGVSRHWFARSRAATHLVNGVNLLFPAGERFFIRSVRHYLDRVPPGLAAEVKGFFGQEGRHAYAHERFFDTLRAQGYDVDAILSRYERVAYDGIERVSPPAVRLAVTVALEHFTALLAADALTDGTLDVVEPEIRDLLEWHAVEELEHKAVAFDVLAAVAPGYVLRAGGMLLAATVLAGFWLYATGALLEQDGSSLRGAARELRGLRREAKAIGKGKLKPIATHVFLRGIWAYLKPGFHPNDRDDRALVAATLARLAERGVIAA